MSEALYDSLLEKWRDFLNQNLQIFGSLMLDNDVEEQYDDLVDAFCKQHGYSERTKNFAFFDRWWDTFADEYYLKLEREEVKIIHENPTEKDWDYGKKFCFNKNGYWEEVEN